MFQGVKFSQAAIALALFVTLFGFQNCAQDLPAEVEADIQSVGNADIDWNDRPDLTADNNNMDGNGDGNGNGGDSGDNGSGGDSDLPEVEEQNGGNGGGSGKVLYYVDFQGARGKAFPRKYEMSAESLQGLANRGRKTPILFNIDTETDNYWLTLAEKELGYKTVKIEDPKALFTSQDLFIGSTFSAPVNTMVVFDQDRQAELVENVAITVSGIDNQVIVPAALEAEFSSWGFKLGVDLRGKWPATKDQKAKAAANIAALKWARENYLGKASKKFAAFSPAGFGRTKGIDFMVQNKLFMSFLDAGGIYVDGSQKLQSEILDIYDNGTIGVGTWSDEGRDIDFLTERGIFRIGGTPNMSAFEKLKPPSSLTQTHKGTARKIQAGKSYIVFSFTQGDALGFCNKDNLRHLESSAGKGIPFSLFHTPLQVLFQPLVMWDLHRRAGTDHTFLGKPCGYASVAQLKPNDFDAYLKCNKYQTGQPFLKEAGIIDIMLNDKAIEDDPKLVGKIINGLPIKPRSIMVKQDLEGKKGVGSKARMINGVAVFHDPVTLQVTKDNKLVLGESLKRIRDAAKVRQFNFVFLSHPVQAEDLKKLYDDIKKDGNIEILSYNDFAETFIKGCPNGGC